MMTMNKLTRPFVHRGCIIQRSLHSRYFSTAVEGEEANHVNLPPLLLARAKARDVQIRTDHLRLNDSFPKESYAPGESKIDTSEIRRKRLIYRSKQRGWLEVDLLMGTWATKYVPTLTEGEMDQYEAILNAETIDIFNYVNGKQEPPMELRTPMLQRLRLWAASKPLGAGPEDYAGAKKDSNMT